MERRMAEALDKHITGNYGEDQFPICDKCGKKYECVCNTIEPQFDRDNCIKMDIDVKDFEKVIDIIAKRSFIFKKFDICPEEIYVFSTRKGWHIYIKMLVEENWTQLTAQDIVFIQAIIGSDFKREVFNWVRVKKGLSKEWNVLFKKKYDKDNNLISEEKFEKGLGEKIKLRLLENELKEKEYMDKIATNKGDV